jgi:hypothetical protein
MPNLKPTVWSNTGFQRPATRPVVHPTVLGAAAEAER